MPEYEEVKQSAAKASISTRASAIRRRMPAKYDVDGILLARPFKIVRHGPIRLFCRDMKKMEAFYTDVMGFHAHRGGDVARPALRVSPLRHRAPLARALPDRAQKKARLSPRTTVMSFGVQLATYRQLRAAIDFLKGRGGKFVEIPPRSPRHRLQRPVLDPAATPSSSITTWSRWMERKAAAQKDPCPGARQPVARRGRAEVRYVYRRALPGAWG